MNADFAVVITDRYGQHVEVDFSDILMIMENKKGAAVIFTRAYGIITTLNEPIEVCNSIQKFIERQVYSGQN